MLHTYFQKQIEKILAQGGIHVNGSDPWDMQVHDNRLFQRILTQGNLGLGEAYMDGWWECQALDQFFFRVLRSKAQDNIVSPSIIFSALIGRLFNLQARSRAFTVGEQHYNMGNELFQGMLDSNMHYSCAYWKNTDKLSIAQENKLRLVFNKLMLQPGQRVLDIGCGWGGAAKFAAEHYGVEVTGITVSSEQVKVAQERCKGLPVKIKLIDYRALDGVFDRIYSIGMFEHVGHKNYRNYFDIIKNLLATDGLFLLQTIGGNESVSSTDPWIGKYIFPNSMLPSASQITNAFEGLLVLEDWHVFSHDYYLTLKTWNDNFQQHCSRFNGHYAARFCRMWRYYLLSCAGAFLARTLQLWQLLLSHQGIVGPFRVEREI
ncbi:MAG: cyclopropane fatty acyl phospholipid synthase [Prosthecochloris sp.]|uniref:cyclopropane fatty acyl phospholipid synthase n=1 Tax=Prosthecochloris sp. TaxID=290513 RepID=UPI0025859EB0|nr:cyclopropane fatty acyl phospholipid synthase [Prosthecochloris sp.]MCW8798238.1 cyclopropane fatty acyl phospholipid synthase [Prosthecochloris sp.]